MKEEKLNKDTVFLALSSLQDVGDGKADYNFDAERAMEFLTPPEIVIQLFYNIPH